MLPGHRSQARGRESPARWGLSKIRGTFLGVPRLRTMVYVLGSHYVGELPGLKELDGDVLAGVDRQLAAEFFACAEEVGLERRPGSSYGLRPKTAPVLPDASPPARSTGRTRSSSRPRSRSSSRPRSGSPQVGPEPALTVPSASENAWEDVEKYQEYTKALQLRLQTTQVECENLQKQVQSLRREAKEPILGTAALRDRLRELEDANKTMHETAAKSRQLRVQLEEKEAELLRRKQMLGSDRPGTGAASARPRTAQAAVESVLLTSQPVTLEGYKARCSALKREVEFERERTLQLRAKLCSEILGRDISPPPSTRS